LSTASITPQTPLSELRERILSERAAIAPAPPRVAELERRHQNAIAQGWEVSDIVVKPDGRIATVQETRGEVTVSRVTTQIFAYVPWDEAELVRRHLPADTTRHGNGWAYTVQNEYGDRFELYLYYDEYVRAYRVRLLAPAVEQVADGHKTHLYGDGHLCLSPAGSGGQHMLNNAFAESVLWCNGIGAISRGHAWPWGQ
jgi:hypothetical protein